MSNFLDRKKSKDKQANWNNSYFMCDLFFVQNYDFY